MNPLNPFECEHPDEAMRWRTRRNGVTVCVIQCLVCGRELRGVRRSDPARRALAVQIPFDEDLAERVYQAHLAHIQQRIDERQAEQAAQSAEWWRRYNAYLLTAEWRDKRQRVLERDDWLCQACRKRRASQVHHLTYARVFHEPLFDLVAVCTICHEALHPRTAEEAA